MRDNRCNSKVREHQLNQNLWPVVLFTWAKQYQGTMEFIRPTKLWSVYFTLQEHQRNLTNAIYQKILKLPL